MGDYYAFPTLQKLKEIPMEFFRSIGAGYRDKYLYETIQSIDCKIIDDISNMPTDLARRELMKFKGVGRKVADCILLFGFGKTDVFPTDTWILKCYKSLFGVDLDDAIKISNKFVERYKVLSGYAQQYLFYQMRENS